jgi:type III secretion protein Q
MTMFPVITDDSIAPALRNFTDYLPAISTALACTSRIAFDVRLESWLTDTLGQSNILDRTAVSVDGKLIGLELQCTHGRLILGVDSSAAPALQVVAELADATLAAAVASVLLQPFIDRLEPFLGSASITCIKLYTVMPEVVAYLHTSKHQIALLECESSLGQRLSGIWQTEQRRTNITSLCRLCIPGRIVVMHRKLPLQMLRSLVPGDLILVTEQQTNSSRSYIVYGDGFMVKAAVDINFKEHVVHVVDTPILEEEVQNQLPVSVSASLDELQLPIGFEIDTARISISELASMRPGYAIELDTPLVEATVRLVCHGQTVGYGQLIAIGERIGVRITRMSFDDEQHRIH